MSRKLRLPLLVLACVGFTAAAATAQTSSASTSITPKTGRTHTRFVVSFVAPASTSQSSVSRSQIHYVVSASMRSRPHGCNSAVSSNVDQATAGSMVHVRLAPNAGHGHWCGGVFRGQVQEIVSSCGGCPGPTNSDILCPAACPLDRSRSMGPDVQVAPQTIGRFSFRVRKAKR